MTIPIRRWRIGTIFAGRPFLSVHFLLGERLCTNPLIVIPECSYRESIFQFRMDSRLERAGMTWYGGYYTVSRAKENEQPSPDAVARKSNVLSSWQRSLFSLDRKERTKEKIKAGERMAPNFVVELKQIIYIRPSPLSGVEYLFLNAPRRNSSNAIFSQAII